MPAGERVEGRFETGRFCSKHIHVPCGRRRQIESFDESRVFECAKPLRQRDRFDLRILLDA